VSPAITVADNPGSERYEITVDGTRAGFVTYRLTPGVIAFLHAEIDPATGGRGLGSRLVAGALDDARNRGLSVVPRCPFVADFIERHPDYADLVAE
jgi:predicted GNAT family acetyltransferase